MTRDTPQPAPTGHPASLLPSLVFRVAAIAGRNRTQVTFAPNREERAAIAAALDLLDLPEMRFQGEIRASGKRDLVLSAQLTARAVQPCSVTLEPVPARVDEVVTRQYLADYREPEGEEAEIPADDTLEPLGDMIDAAAVAIEALALALPLYPRAPGVDLGEVVAAPPGETPIRDADLKPFAGLAKLIGGGDKDGEGG